VGLEEDFQVILRTVVERNLTAVPVKAADSLEEKAKARTEQMEKLDTEVKSLIAEAEQL